jgi:CBS domain-containing protein
MEPDEGATAFLNELRTAREAAQADGENAADMLTAFDRLGFHLCRPTDVKDANLGCYETALVKLASGSEWARALKASRDELTPSELFESVRKGRNDHMHTGVAARRLVGHAIQFSLLLEAGLKEGFVEARHFMVRNPVCAEKWQTVAQVKQAMLLHQFSYLPYRMANEQWVLIRDAELVKFLLAQPSRQATIIRPLSEVMPLASGIGHKVPRFVRPSQKVTVEDAGEHPVLVTDNGTATGRLEGIITAFDLL